MADEKALSSNERLDQSLRNKIGGFLLEPDTRDGGDTLAIALCSYFESHIARPADDTESENGWSQWAEDKTNAAIDALTRALSGGEDRSPCLNPQGSGQTVTAAEAVGITAAAPVETTDSPLVMAYELLAAARGELPDPDFIPEEEREDRVRRLAERIDAWLSVTDYMKLCSVQETSAQRIGARIPYDIGLRGDDEEGVTAPGEELFGGKTRLPCGCIDICTNQRDHEQSAQNGKVSGE